MIESNFIQNLCKDLSFEQLQTHQGLERLDDAFLKYIGHQDEQLLEQLLLYRKHSLPGVDRVNNLLLGLAPWLETFLAEFYSIVRETEALKIATLRDQVIFAFRKHYVLPLKLKPLQMLEDIGLLQAWLNEQLLSRQLDTLDCELAVAELSMHYWHNKECYPEECKRLSFWCSWALHDPEGQKTVDGWVSFKLPGRMHYDQLVDVAPVAQDEPVARLQSRQIAMHLEEQASGTISSVRAGPGWEREGFDLTDLHMSRREVMYEVNYCLYCHQKGSDFCSTGFPVKTSQPALGFRRHALGDWAHGCPLEEKISQMHLLKRQGYSVAALAMVMVDNPLCPLTGHRICNDCMKSCIYQKQEPVDIPHIETRVLTDVLHLPWGVELYDLLTRWNPLRDQQWIPKPYNGRKVLVMGMGPAGLSLAHHLLMEGCYVVGMDGLKIEPLPEVWVTQPIENYEQLLEPLSERIVWGLGGVCEYGITVRWDKNFLKLIYINLMRRSRFHVWGNVRFGGSLTVERAFQMGFDHLAVAVGAGLPKELPIDGSLAPGMHQASDFLMALQLSGAAKPNSVSSLQVRLPAVIIGGGLTGVDTATEVQAYYAVQIEKNLKRYEHLVEAWGKCFVWERFSLMERAILEEQLAHARELRVWRRRGSEHCRVVSTAALLRRWGGVTIVYRKRLQDSPAYHHHPEELNHALAEGILYAEHLQPLALRLDEHGQASVLVCCRLTAQDGEDDQVLLPAQSVFVATGSKPNVAYEFEHRGTFQRQKNYLYQPYILQDDGRSLVSVPFEEDTHCKQQQIAPFTSYQQGDHRVTFLGDTHPLFRGSVVKAIASGRVTYPAIMRHLIQLPHQNSGTLKLKKDERKAFFESLQNHFTARIVDIKPVGREGLYMRIQAPAAVASYRPGEFYRLQLYETHMKRSGHVYAGDPCVLWPQHVNREAGWLEVVGDTQQPEMLWLGHVLKPQDEVALMGPSGVHISIPKGREFVLMIADASGLLHIPALARAWRCAGHRVWVLMPSFVCEMERLGVQDTLASVIDGWIQVQEPWQEVFEQLVRRQKPYDSFPWSSCRRIHVIGSGDLLMQVRQAQCGVWRGVFPEELEISAAVQGPMQCMLKGVCAQCLQWQVDPQTGQRTKAIFACSWQDQPLEKIDIHHMQQRQQSQAMSRRLNGLWLRMLDEDFSKHGLSLFNHPSSI